MIRFIDVMLGFMIGWACSLALHLILPRRCHAAEIDPVAVGSGVTNTMNNPIPVAIAGVVVLILFFVLKAPFMRWLQRQQDQKNQDQVKKTTESSASENDQLNQDFHP